MIEPRYKHNNDKDVFLGYREEYDIYLKPGECLVLRFADSKGATAEEETIVISITTNDKVRDDIPFVRFYVRRMLKSADKQSLERETQPNDGGLNAQEIE